jgi:NAD(P)-dependent dehydrogenase (short-subunit alcohol dehydrogenase family)
VVLSTARPRPPSRNDSHLCDDSHLGTGLLPAGVNIAAPVLSTPTPYRLIGSPRLGATTALGRARRPEEIVPVVTFLASPRSSYVTGALYAVDGGSTA